MKRIISLCLTVLLLIGLLSACGRAESNKAYDSNYGSAIDSVVGGDGAFGDKLDNGIENAPNASPDYGHDNDSPVDDYDERKIIYTVYTELQTKDFDKAISVINGALNSNNGYIQSQKQTNDGGINSKYSRRSTTMVIRVPSAKLEAFLAGLQNENIYTLSLSKDSKDYSSSYYDKESRVNSLRVQEERLLSMLEKASDLKTLLELEDRLSTVRYQIESLTREMNYIDSNVDYATVTINLTEVVKYDEVVEEPVTFFERVKEAIGDSWSDFVDGVQDFVVWVIYAFPTLMVLGGIVLIVVLIVKKSKKKKNFTAAANSNVDRSTNSNSK
jgi:hypothetical protein